MRDESNKDQLALVQGACQEQHACQLDASRGFFGKDECPGTEDEKMALWLEYSCVGGTDRTTTNAPKCKGIEPPSGPPPTNCKGGNREQLDVRGCGGWINLDCRGGCLNIRKVRQIQHANLFQAKFHDKGEYGTTGLVFPSHTIYKGVKIFRPLPSPSLLL